MNRKIGTSVVKDVSMDIHDAAATCTPESALSRSINSPQDRFSVFLVTDCVLIKISDIAPVKET